MVKYKLEPLKFQTHIEFHVIYSPV